MAKCGCSLSGVPTNADREGRVEWMRRAIPKGSSVYFVTDGKSSMHVRLFISPKRGEVQDITRPAASLTHQRMSTSDWMVFSGGGFSAGHEAVTNLAVALWNSEAALRPLKV